MNPNFTRRQFDLVCTECNKEFRGYVSLTRNENFKMALDKEQSTACSCGSKKWEIDKDKHKKNRSTGVIIPNKHRAVKKSGPEGSIPLGEMVGDDDYDWMDNGGIAGPIP